MPATLPPPPCHASVRQANDAIRALAGSVTVWTPEALAELDGLRRQWDEALAREADRGATRRVVGGE